MPCHHPIPAWRTQSGDVKLHKQPQGDAQPLQLPCGNCLGCRTAAAQAWTLRCHLELQQHAYATATTWTYDEEHLPPTLRRRDLQLAIKRLRRSTPTIRLRYFGCGEYGEQTARPHYHAILYGLHHEQHRHEIENAWHAGHTHLDNASPEAIAYIAGYTAKKLTPRNLARRPTELTDPSTGEVFTWQPPFLQMSRRPGIAAHARQYRDSWRLYAIAPNSNGKKQPVPRYLHAIWKQTATKQEIEQLEQEKYEIRKNRENTERSRQAQEKINEKRIQLANERRHL